MFCITDSLKKIPSIIIISVIIQITILSASLYFGQQIIEFEKNEILLKYSNRVTLVVKNIEKYLDDAKNVIEVTSKLPIVRNTDFANYISEEYKGIPQDKDLEKRDLAKNILEQYPGFEFVTFHMPNGDFYLMEPYNAQINLTKLNFADRDWYEGVINTSGTYLSEVYNSSTLNRNVVAIRTPVFDDAGNLIGIWGGSLSLEFLQKSVEGLIIDKNQKFIFYDIYGNQILNTSTNKINEEIPHDIIQKALSGQKEVEISNDLVVAYSPIRVGNTNLALAVIQPYDDAFFSITVTQGLITSMAIVFSIILGLSSYYVYKNTQKNLKLLNELEKTSVYKEVFSAMVTHELKTPLMPILGYCRMLKNNMLGELNRDQSESIESIEKNAKQLEVLISDIMDSRKLDLDKMRFKIEDVSLDEFF